jgi:hypothetical protein
MVRIICRVCDINYVVINPRDIGGRSCLGTRYRETWIGALALLKRSSRLAGHIAECLRNHTHPKAITKCFWVGASRTRNPPEGFLALEVMGFIEVPSCCLLLSLDRITVRLLLLSPVRERQGKHRRHRYSIPLPKPGQRLTSAYEHDKRYA